MPRVSERAKILRSTSSLIDVLGERLIRDEFIHAAPRDPLLTDVFTACAFLHHKVTSSRYLVGRIQRKHKRKFHDILYGEDVGHEATERDFLFHYRIPRQSFWHLVQTPQLWLTGSLGAEETSCPSQSPPR